MKIIKIKYRDRLYDVLLDDEDYSVYKNKTLRLNNSRGKLFVLYCEYSSMADATFLHRLILNCRYGKFRVKFKDGNSLNLQKKNLILLTEKVKEENYKKWYKKTEKHRQKNHKIKYEKIKKDPYAWSKYREYLTRKQKENRAKRTAERLKTCERHQLFLKYQNFFTKSEINLLIRKFKYTKLRAKERQLNFNLDFDYYVDLIKKGCYYTGQDLLLIDNGGSSLDRIDNSKGYEYGNVLPCVGWVNKMRSDFLTVEETKIAVNAILTYRNNNVKL